MLEIRRLSFTFQHTLNADSGFGLTCDNFLCKGGQLVVIIGHNGSGKTTLLRLIAGELWPDEGEIILNGKPSARNRVAWLDVGQAERLVPELLVIDHVAYAMMAEGLRPPVFPRSLKQSRLPHGLASEKMTQAIGKLLHEPVRELSTGQMQQLACYLSLLQTRDAILADETTAHFDAVNARNFCAILKTACQKGNVPAVLITHDLSLAAEFADRVYMASLSTSGGSRILPVELPDNREGRIEILKQSIMISVHGKQGASD